MLKFFRFPFASAGDKTAIPDPTDVNGYVSYQQGYGLDYQRQKTDPLAKNIERDRMNQLFYDITQALAELQSQGVPDFIGSTLNGGSPYSYSKNALVRWTDDEIYRSLVAANTADPSDPLSWSLVPLSSAPVGSIIVVPATAAPDGYIKLNGALLSRATYSDLWAYAQASGNIAASDGAWVDGQFSPGDGSTTFRIPDGRGNFFRGWDDVRGIDSGRSIGSLQLDQFQGHTFGDSAGVMRSRPVMGSGAGTVVRGDSTGTVLEIQDDGTNGTPRFGAETRPRNIPLLACIKY